MKRVHVLYKGNVQGVGFRFTTINTAKNYNINGWVKNLPAGQVEVVAEGEENELKQFLDSLQQKMAGYIQDKDVWWQESKNEFVSFDMR
jgi:acylphosphatase